MGMFTSFQIREEKSFAVHLVHYHMVLSKWYLPPLWNLGD